MSPSSCCKLSNKVIEDAYLETLTSTFEYHPIGCKTIPDCLLRRPSQRGITKVVLLRSESVARHRFLDEEIYLTPWTSVDEG